jgi:hypothetical protein
MTSRPGVAEAPRRERFQDSFSADLRTKTMRSAQDMSSAVYVLFVAFSLILFALARLPSTRRRSSWSPSR